MPGLTPLLCTAHLLYARVCQAWCYAVVIRRFMGLCPTMRQNNFDYNVWYKHRAIFHRVCKYVIIICVPHIRVSYTCLISVCHMCRYWKFFRTAEQEHLADIVSDEENASASKKKMPSRKKRSTFLKSWF